jgi:hypothetical protein
LNPSSGVCNCLQASSSLAIAADDCHKSDLWLLQVHAGHFPAHCHIVGSLANAQFVYVDSIVFGTGCLDETHMHFCRELSNSLSNRGQATFTMLELL